MDNNNGALSFDVLIRDNNIDAMLTKDEQRIMEFADNVEGESQSIVSSFQNIGSTIAGLAIAATLKSWVSDIISVRGEFQQLEIAFSTMLGSAEQATSLMQQLTQTAATTPFDLKGVAQSAKQLLAYGESADKVNETLVRLGNIASGLSIPLNDLTYLYGTTMVQGRLFTQDVRQFMGRGIPLVQELSKALGKTTDEINQMVTDGKIGFEEVQLVIENLTNQGGMFYGLMEQQSKSLTGQISNLEDAWDMMLNDIGQNTEGVLSGSISVITSLVENYDDCIRVLGALVTMYGTYKVAMASVAIAQKRSTGIAALDNIVLKARAGLFTANVEGGMQVVRTQQQMTAAQQAYTAELQKALTLEQQEQILRNVKVAAMQGLLTAEQQLYVSRLNLTAGSVEYVAAMESVLTADQRAELEKRNLTKTGMAYSVAVQQAVQATQNEVQAQLMAARAEAATLKQKQQQLLIEYRASQQKIQQTRVQIALAQQEGNTTAVAALKQQQYNQLQQHAVIVKQMAATATAKDAATEKVATLAKQQGALASKQQAASDTLLATTKGVLSTATKGLIASLRTLWATMIANPITAIISIVGALASAMLLLGDDTDDAKDAVERFGESGEKQAASINTLVAVLKAGDKGTNTWKKALDELNAKLKEHGLRLLGEKSTMEDIEEAERKLTATIKKEGAERDRANALANVEEEYKNTLDNIGKMIEKELKEAHHYEWSDFWGIGTSWDSKDIQERASALAGQIRGVIEDKLQEIVNLPDDKKEEAKQKLRKQITDIMVAANIDKSHAEFITDYDWLDDMFYDVFSEKGGIIDQALEARKAFDKQTEAANNSADAIIATAKAEGQLGDAAEGVVPKVDLSKYSLEELHKMAEQLEGTNISLDVTLYGYTEAKAMLEDLKREIGIQQGNLNTENGINDEIKRLKTKRAEAELGSEAWKKLDAQITALEGKLPKSHDSAASAARKAANEAQRAADALQQAGQKAVEVQLEVEEKRTAAIKDGYEKRRAELELEHKKELARIDKEQQELEKAYKRGGKAMPTDVSANFDELRTLENANYETQQTLLLQTEMEERKKQYEQYYKWVAAYGEDVANKQFAKLIEQGNTYEEWLTNKVRELTARMDAGEELTTEQGTTLINMQEELRTIKGIESAVEQFNESLAKTKDNAKTASDYIAALAAKKQELQQGKTDLIGEDRAKAIAQIDREIAEQTEQLQKQLLEKYRTNAELRADVEREYQQEITWLQQHGYDEQAAVAERARRKALGELQAQQIQSTDIWQHLFRDAQYLSGKAFDNIKEQLKQLIEAIEDADIKKALLGQLEDLERQTQGSKNPFKQLVNSIKEYKNAADGTAEKKEKLLNMMGDISSAADMVKQSFDSIVDGLKKMGLAGDEETQEMLGNISEMMGGITTLSKGISTGNPVDIISGGVSLVTSAISLFDSTSRRIKREMKAHQKQLGILQRMYAQVQWEIENSVGEEYYSNSYKAIENLKQQAAEYRELSRLEASKKSKDRDDGKVQEYLKSAEDAERQIQDIYKNIRETLVQTTFKDLANDMAEAWAESMWDMEESAEKFDDIWNKTIQNAIKNSLKLKIIEPVVAQFTQTLANYMGAHDNSVAGFNFAYWKTMLQNAGNAFTEGLKGFEDFFSDMGDEVGKAAETLEGQVAGVTETTASKVAGEMTTMRIRQYEQLVVQQNIEAACVQANQAVRNCISYLQTIARNTSYNSELVGIKQQLIELNQKIESDPLRAKGVSY